MAHGNFIWADLSTFRPEVTQPFYRTLFGWRFDGYVASNSAGAVAGMFEMPEKFQAISMPSFWMSYIAVDDINATVELANQLGGKVELGPEPFEGGGQFALIRDPLGAGFTVYQGVALKGVMTGVGARMGHGLFVSDASSVRDFYTGLFGWTFGDVVDGTQSIQVNGRVISHLHEIPDPAVRGTEQFWAVSFSHADLSKARSEIVTGGGQILAEVDLPEGPSLLARDPDGAACFVVSVVKSQPLDKPKFRWKAWGGMALILVTLVTKSQLPWVVFLTVWVVEGLRTKTTWVFESVPRDEAKLLYWSVMALYAALAVLALIV